MSTIKKVSTSAEPDDAREVELAPDGYPFRPLPPRVEGAYFDARIPKDVIDTLRKSVRQRSYGNSTEEAETIRKTDEAVFEKVRVAEQYQIGRADSLLERNKGRVGAALSYTEQIDSLRARLRAGEDTTTIAREFNKLEQDIRHREIAVLNSMAVEAEGIEAALSDPVAHAQRIYSMMPIANGRAAGLIG